MQKRLGARVVIAALALAMMVTAVSARSSREEILGEDTILYNPYEPKENEYKGQLHSHSSNGPGGVDTPVALETAYRDAGYDFVAITDHNVLTPDPGVGGILHIDGVEESAIEGHIISIDPDSRKAPGAAQDIIDAILADGAIPIMAHPNTGNHWTDIELETLVGYLAIEVYNSRSAPLDQEAGDKWDALLSKGRETWGTAVDDCHSITGPQFNKGWVIVFADDLTVADIVATLKAGNFYSSTGPTLSISLSGETITVVTDSPSTIDWIGEGGEILQQRTNATTNSFIAWRLQYYVRVRITRDSDGKKAWSNPFYTVGGYKHKLYLPLVMK